MNTKPKMSLRACYGLLTVCALLYAVGCSEGRESLHEHDHHKPSHWPTDLQDAAGKIRERVILANESSDAAPFLNELRDLVAWVPEIAADTEIIEADWNPIYRRSETLRGHLNQGGIRIRDVESELEQLAGLLESTAGKLMSISDHTTDTIN